MRKRYTAGLAVVTVCVATYFLIRNKSMAPTERKTISDGIVITSLEREVSDVERLLEARFWEFRIQMPDNKVSLHTKLELFHKGKVIRYLSGSTVGPSFDASSQQNDGKPFNLIVGLYPPGGSWNDSKVKALCALKTSGGTFGTVPQIVDFPSRGSGWAYGGAVYDSKKKTFLLMAKGNDEKTNAMWPIPRYNDYAVYLTIEKLNLHYPKT